MGSNYKNPFIRDIIEGLKNKEKKINFDDFLNVAGHKIGDVKTKEGLKKVFEHFDREEDGFLDFEEFKHIAKKCGDMVTDEDLLEMMHSTFINQKTKSNEGFVFEEFYQIVSKFNKK